MTRLNMCIEVASLRNDSNDFEEEPPSSPSNASSDAMAATSGFSLDSLLDPATNPDVSLPDLLEILQACLAHPEAKLSQAEALSLQAAILRAISRPNPTPEELAQRMEVAWASRQWMNWRRRQIEERKLKKHVRRRARTAEYQEVQARRKELVKTFVRMRCARSADSAGVFGCAKWTVTYPGWARKFDRQTAPAGDQPQSESEAGGDVEAWLAAQMAQMTVSQSQYVQGLASPGVALASERSELLRGSGLDKWDSLDAGVGSYQSEDLYDA